MGSVVGRYVFERGADALPSIGAAVVLPTEKQLRSIVESGEQRRIKIGESPLAGDAEVCIDPNRLLSRTVEWKSLAEDWQEGVGE